MSQSLAVHATSKPADGNAAMDGTGTCFEVIANPFVIGSIYGPLIDGFMYIDCFGWSYHDLGLRRR